MSSGKRGRRASGYESDEDYTDPSEYAPDRRKWVLGGTPSKDSATGRAVLSRWAAKGKAIYNDAPLANPSDAQLSDLVNWKVRVRKKHTYDPSKPVGRRKAEREWVGLTATQPSSGSGRPIPLIHMGHRVAAATFWERGSAPEIRRKEAIDPKGGKYAARYHPYRDPGYAHGRKSAYARRFMTDPANYRFEYGPLNSSRGSGGDQFVTPPSGETWPKRKK